MKKIIFIAVIIIIIFVIYQVVLKNKAPEYELVEVARGSVVQEILETGQVQRGDRINLSFKNAGRIEKIYVVVGEEIKTGDILAKLDVSQLSIQLQEAQAAFSLARAQLDKLLAGATPEEINAAQTEVQNKQIALNTAEQNLQNAYESSFNTLNDAYLKAYNAQNVAVLIQRTYFSGTDQQGIRVKESKEAIERAVLEIKSYLTQENIDGALSQAKNELSLISGSLRIIREACEDPVYRDVVLSADKTSLDTQRTNINTAITDITTSQQLIISAKSSVESAAGNLQTAKDSLALTTAFPRQEDVDYYQANLEKARAQVNVLEAQIQDSYLRSPLGGQIIEIKKRVGELSQASPQDIVMTILPSVPYEIKVDVYEENVVKINIGNPVEISLIAFPKKIFKGRVTSISPAEKIIDGVVYYEIIIGFEETPENIKPSMTADVVIETAFRENVLTIPGESIIKEKDKKIVQVFKDGQVEEREIETGLVGTSDDMVEVLSGLNEGEEIILQ